MVVALSGKSIKIVMHVSRFVKVQHNKLANWLFFDNPEKNMYEKLDFDLFYKKQQLTH